MAAIIIRASKKGLFWLGVALIYLLPVVVVYGGFDAFLKFEGIDGESADKDHPGWVDVISFSHGMSQAISSPSAGRIAGGSVHEDYKIVKALDTASPLLYLYCSDGQHIPQVTLELDKVIAGGLPVKFYKVTLTDVIISSVKPVGDTQGTGDKPTEEIDLNYAKVTWEYTVVDSGGQTGITVTTSWDRTLLTP